MEHRLNTHKSRVNTKSNSQVDMDTDCSNKVFRCNDYRACKVCRNSFAKNILDQLNEYESLYVYETVSNDYWERVRKWLIRNNRGQDVYWRFPLDGDCFIVISSLVWKRYKASQLPSGDELSDFVDNLLKSRQDGMNISRNSKAALAHPTNPNHFINYSAFPKKDVFKAGEDLQKEFWRVNTQNMRSKVLGLVSDLTLDEWVDILKHFDNKCVYCGGDFDEMDHIVGISDGGGTTRYNVVPSCKKCNREKNHVNRRKYKRHQV